MKTEKFSGVIENAYGYKLTDLSVKLADGTVVKNTEPKLAYDAEVLNYETIDEIRAAKDEPSDEQVVKFKNQTRKANARQKFMQKALDDAGFIEPTLENDDQLKLKTMFDVFMSIPGTTEAEAREKASNSIGVQWAVKKA